MIFIQLNNQVIMQINFIPSIRPHLINSIQKNLFVLGGILVFACLIPDPSDVTENFAQKENAVSEAIAHVQHDCKKNKNSRKDEELLLQKQIPVDDSYSSFTKLLQEKGNASGRDFQENESSTQIDTQPPLEPVIKSIGLVEAFLLPGVIRYALTNACVKTVSYSFFMWLPTYLSQGLHWSDKQSSSLSNCFDVGGVIGTIITGVLSDLLVCRSPVVSFSLIMSMALVYLYQAFASDCITNVVLMLLIGATLVGPASLITSVISTDLGRNERIAGDTAAVATVSGIIDGTGSLGAALGQFLVGSISKYYGWKYVFYFLNIMIGLGFVSILTITVEEIRAWRKKKRSEEKV